MKRKFLIFILVILCPLLFPKFFTNQLEKPLVVSQTPITADVIVIHGGSTTKNNKLPLLAQQRLTHGLFLWRKGLASYILVTGGETQFNNVEAEVMANELITRGVPKNNILLEDKSSSTKENVINSVKILKKNNFNSVLVVTSPYHSLRTTLVWKKFWPNKNLTVSPAEKTIANEKVNPYRALFSIVREYTALIWYKLNNWI